MLWDSELNYDTGGNTLFIYIEDYLTSHSNQLPQKKKKHKNVLVIKKSYLLISMGVMLLCI